MTADLRFHRSAGPLRLAELAEAVGGSAHGDPDRRFTGVAPLQVAGPGEVSFLENRRYLPALRETAAGAVVLAPGLLEELPPGVAAITVKAPYLAYARIGGLLHPAPLPDPGIHPTAVIAADAQIGAGCEIGPGAVVGARAEIGAGCILGPYAVVGAGVVLGPGCHLHAHSSISHALCGAGVVLHPGARVGQEGFGFAPTPEGGYLTVPQLGRVILHDRVEIGANSCVDRGSGHDTVLGAGTRLDNLVQIGHNVQTGSGCVVVAQAGISGSTALGDYVMVAAQAGVIGHLHIGSKARIGAQSGVTKDVPAGGDVFGSPALPARAAWRMLARMRMLGRVSDSAAAADSSPTAPGRGQGSESPDGQGDTPRGVAGQGEGKGG